MTFCKPIGSDLKDKWIVTFENFDEIKDKLRNIEGIKIEYVTKDKKVFLKTSEEKLKSMTELKIVKYELRDSCNVSLN